MTLQDYKSYYYKSYYIAPAGRDVNYCKKGSNTIRFAGPPGLLWVFGVDFDGSVLCPLVWEILVRC
jgi:hypothetical protein